MPTTTEALRRIGELYAIRSGEVCKSILAPKGCRFLTQALSQCLADCELTDAIEARSRLLRIADKRLLFRQGQPPDRLFLLQAGEVVLTSKRPGGPVIGFRAVPGSLIGLPAIAGNVPYSMTATVTRYSELHAISILTFREIVDSNPRLSMRVLAILAAEVRSARHLLSTALSSVTSRPPLPESLAISG